MARVSIALMWQALCELCSIITMQMLSLFARISPTRWMGMNYCCWIQDDPGMLDYRHAQLKLRALMRNAWDSWWDCILPNKCTVLWSHAVLIAVAFALDHKKIHSNITIFYSQNFFYLFLKSERLMYTHEYTRTMCLLLLLAIES